MVDGGFHVSIDIPKYRKLSVIPHATNVGKSAAVRTGLRYVQTRHVLLMDADMTGIAPSIVDAFIHTARVAHLDMLIGRCQKTLPGNRGIGIGYVFQRHTDYQGGLSVPCAWQDTGSWVPDREPALNHYASYVAGRTAFTDVPFVQYRKKDKYGLVKGLRLDLTAIRQR